MRKNFDKNGKKGQKNGFTGVVLGEFSKNMT